MSLVEPLSSFFRPRFKVLAYHSVAERSSEPYEVSIEAFAEQMETLAVAGYRVVSLRDALGALSGNRIAQKTVVITFDDGFESLGRNAVPILRQKGFPATIFVPTDLVGKTDVFVYKDESKGRRILDWLAIQELHRSGVDFGSHTMTHPNLVALDDDALLRELRYSRQALLERIRVDFCALAYPFGLYDDRVKRAARESGYDCALSFGDTLSNAPRTDQFSLRREAVVAATSMTQFRRIVDTRFDLLRKLEHLLRKKHR